MQYCCNSQKLGKRVYASFLYKGQNLQGKLVINSKFALKLELLRSIVSQLDGKCGRGAQNCRTSKDIPEGTSLSEREHREVSHHGGAEMLYSTDPDPPY